MRPRARAHTHSKTYPSRAGLGQDSIAGPSGACSTMGLATWTQANDAKKKVARIDANWAILHRNNAVTQSRWETASSPTYMKTSKSWRDKWTTICRL